jgi:histidine triad (HIT) family protein
MAYEENIFTKIIEKKIPAKIEYEDDEILAFHDINPQAPLHLLIIPKKKIATLNDITTEDTLVLGKLILVAKNLAAKFGFSQSGYRIVMNCNEDGGQSVYHIHLHLLAGRKLHWPPG